jgi:protein tyrosine/serine phosphatase
VRFVLLILVLAVMANGCAGYVAAPGAAVSGAPPAYAALRAQLTRFAQVDGRLYRGGQPTPSQIQLLYDLGVRTVISLRPEERDGAAEEEAARRLGMRFIRRPFSALSAPDDGLLHQIVDELRAAASDGPVYVHCHAGRDRTSLIVALYRVWAQSWSPVTAWQRESLDFGHGQMLFFRSLDRAFARLTAAHS